MANNPAPKILFETLRDRGLPVNEKDIKKAFSDDSSSALESWVNEHLHEDTLLTKDELSLYSALEKSGVIDALATYDLSHVRSFNDHTLQKAIDELTRSTAIIEKQTEALRIQQDAVASLVKTNKQNQEARTSANNKQQKAWLSEYSNLSNAVEELLQNLAYQVVELEAQSKAADAIVNQSALETLAEDDKLLSSLQKLSNELDPGSTEENEAAQRIRQLCARLIKYMVEGVRAHLDRIYIEESTTSFNGRRHDVTEDDDEVIALRQELDSLYSEILPVSQMSVEQQYLQPALREIHAQDICGKYRSIKALSYISSCLVFLTNRLQTLSSQAEVQQSHRAAIHHLTSAIRAELALPAPSSPLKDTSSRSPLRRRNSKPITPVRPRITARRRSSAGSFEEDIAPEEALLRSLGIFLPVDQPSDRTIAASLQDVLSDRMIKLKGHEKNIQSSSESAIGAQIQDAFVTLQLLRDSLMNETPFASLKLADEEAEKGIQSLENDLQDIRSGIEAVDVEALKGRNPKRDMIVERWAR